MSGNSKTNKVATLYWDRTQPGPHLNIKMVFPDVEIYIIQSNPVISRAVNSRKSVSRACTLDPKF